MLSMAELRRLANSRPGIDKTAVVPFRARPPGSPHLVFRSSNNISDADNRNIIRTFLASTPVPLLYSNMRAESELEDGIAFLHWRFILPAAR